MRFAQHLIYPCLPCTLKEPQIPILILASIRFNITKQKVPLQCNSWQLDSCTWIRPDLAKYFRYLLSFGFKSIFMLRMLSQKSRSASPRASQLIWITGSLLESSPVLGIISSSSLFTSGVGIGVCVGPGVKD